MKDQQKCIVSPKLFSVVVVASRAGALRGIENEDTKKRFLSESLTETDIENVIDEYKK